MNVLTFVLLEVILPWLLKKSAEKALDLLLEKLLSDNNLKHLTNSLKLQILVLYLDWALHKAPVKALPHQERIAQEPAHLGEPVSLIRG